MKRSIGILALAAALGVALAVPAATAGDAKGPPCTNFIRGDAAYNSATGTVTAEMMLAAAGCTGTYLLDVYGFTSTGTGTPLAADVPSSGSLTDPETGNTIVLFSYTFSSGAPTDGVCLVVESYHRGRLADRAPNSGCEAIEADSGGASGGFN